jgi:sulfatase modifying factor 1
MQRFCNASVTALVMVGCSVSDARFTPLSIDADPTRDDAPTTTGELQLSIVPSTFDLHVADTRAPRITLVNERTDPITPSAISTSGLTLAALSIPGDQCTSELGPGERCTITTELTGMFAGAESITITSGDASATAMLTVRLACPTTCGPTGTANCCASTIVPGNAPGSTLEGQPYFRGYDVGFDNAFPSMAFPATVNDFRLDTYEVTVGRFRAFVQAGFGTQTSAPAVGAGAHRAIQGSGWDASWNPGLPLNSTELMGAVQCGTGSSWNSGPANEGQPINCTSWYVAMAFCIWDGGYLPTETEWGYAASGGSDHRMYPWSVPPGASNINCSFANYNADPANAACVDAVNRVGTESPKGDGRWGHADLAGNVSEWVLDGRPTGDTYPLPCANCATLAAPSQRVKRGGSWTVAFEYVRPARRDGASPTSRGQTTGFRCARDP